MNTETPAASLKSRVILVVDDTAITRIGTAMSVQALGYSVEEVASGAAALKKLESCYCAAVLMDLLMPDMSGLECTKKIRAIEIGSGKRIPIIIFSSLNESAVKRDCLDAGMDAFLDKACSSEELAKVLQRFIPNPDLPGLVD